MLPPLLDPRHRLSAQLFWRFLLLSLPLLAAGGVVLSVAASRQVQRQAAESLAAVADDKASKIEAYARGKLRDIQFLAAQPYMPGLLSTGRGGAERPALLRFIGGISGYRNLCLFSPRGDLLFSRNPEATPTPELLRTVDRTRTLLSAEISDYTLDPASGMPAVYVAAPVFGPGGSISGVVAGRLLNEEIYRVVNDYANLGVTGETVIAQAEGDRIVVVVPLRHDPDAAFRLSFAEGRVPQALQAAVEGSRFHGVTKDYRGKETLAVSRYLPSLGWGMVVKIDAREVFAPAEGMRRGIVLGGLGLVVLLAIGANAAAQSLNRPLRALTEAARRVEEGDLAARAGLDRRADEFGFLGHAFDGMAERIQRDTENLRQTNEGLEQKVAARTRALHAKTEEAERANHAKSEFLANMSHELRTPLNGILGYAQILQNLPALPEKVRSGLTVIRQSGEHLLTLINDILDLAKIEARRIELLLADIPLRDFLRGPIGIFQVRAEQKGIAFEAVLDPDLPEVVRADEKRLRQILLNLLGNAVKFTDKGAVRFEVARLDDRIRFSIRDTGIGIAPTKIGLLFQPFSQVADAARNAEGTGLGLALSQRLVQLMGGVIEVESEYAKGSVFRFDLLLAPGDSAAAPAPAPPAAAAVGYTGPRRKILVVDDIPTNRAVIADMLAPLGFDIAEAGDGREALDRLPEVRPDLVLTDIAMPVIDGVQLIQYIRQIAAFRSLPIIPFSASVADDEAKRCRALGCTEFLGKPVDYACLLDALRRALGLEWIVSRDRSFPAAPVASAALLAPPPAAAALADFAQQGDLVGLAAAARALAEADPALHPFVDRLLELVEGFQIRQIQEIFEPRFPTP